MQIRGNRSIQGATICLVLICQVIAVSAQKTVTDRNDLSVFEKQIDEGKYPEVEKALFDYLIANPRDAKGFAMMAKLRLVQNRPNEARSLAGKALTLDPNLLTAKLSLAEAYFQLGESQESQTLLSGIYESEISENSAGLDAVRVFALVGNCPAALKAAEKLPLKVRDGKALPIRARCLMETGDRQGLDSLLKTARPIVRQDPDLAVSLARVLSNGALNKEAAEILRPAILSNPRNVAALALLAKSEIYLKELASAKIHLAQAEKLQPNSAELLFVRSLLESEQGNNSGSVVLLEKSLAADPDNTEVLARLVVTAMRANQAAKAVRAAERLIGIKGDDLEFLYLYGAASLQNNDLQQAESSLTKYLGARPNDSRGCLALGLTFAAQKDKLQTARQQLQHCLDIDPNAYEAAYQLGLSYKTQGDMVKATEYLEQTVRLAPNYALSLRDLGAVYLQTGAESKARPLLEKAVLLDPNDADTHFQLSRLYNLIGERALGQKHLELFQKLKNPRKDGM